MAKEESYQGLPFLTEGRPTKKAKRGVVAPTECAVASKADFSVAEELKDSTIVVRARTNSRDGYTAAWIVHQYVPYVDIERGTVVELPNKQEMRFSGHPEAMSKAAYMRGRHPGRFAVNFANKYLHSYLNILSEAYGAETPKGGWTMKAIQNLGSLVDFVFSDNGSGNKIVILNSQAVSGDPGESMFSDLDSVSLADEEMLSYISWVGSASEYWPIGQAAMPGYMTYTHKGKTLEAKMATVIGKLLIEPNPITPIMKSELLGELTSFLWPSASLRLINGPDIFRFYKGSRCRSCMSGGSAVKTRLYAVNPDRIAMLTYKDTGRALVWKADNGDILLDRIYGDDKFNSLAERWCKKNNVIDIYNRGTTYKSWRVTLSNHADLNVPYCDSFGAAFLVEGCLVAVSGISPCQLGMRSEGGIYSASQRMVSPKTLKEFYKFVPETASTEDMTKAVVKLHASTRKTEWFGTNLNNTSSMALEGEVDLSSWR